MKGLLWVLALFAAAVAIAVVAPTNAGYVILVLPPYRQEISLNAALLLCLAAFVILYALTRGICRVRALFRRPPAPPAATAGPRTPAGE